MYTTLFSYALWRKDVSIKDIPYNDTDYLILTLLSYLRFSTIKDQITLPASLSTLFSYYKKTDHEYDESFELFKLISSSKRYSHIQIIDFLDEKDEIEYKQFFALTYLLNNNTIFITFRGTDDSWIGWKENMSLLYESHIPSHKSSLQYIYTIIDKINIFHIQNKKINHLFNTIYNYFKPYSLIISGHSKGGHLALYSAMHVDKDIQNHIIRVINYDGPGLLLSMLEKLDYYPLLPKIISYVPQFSFFGLLFFHEENYKVIHSSAVGLNQHDPLSWCVDPDGFVEDDLRQESLEFFIKMNMFLNKMTTEEKRILFTSLFELFTLLKIHSFNDLYHLHFKHLLLGMKEIRYMNSHIRKKLIEFLRLLYFEAMK